MTMNVLFPSVGRRVELLRAFRRAREALGLPGVIVALDMDPLAPGLQVADRSYVIPPLDSAEYVPTLVQVCREERIDLVFPLIDPDIQVLAEHRGALEAIGARVAVVGPEAAAIAGDKWRSQQLFQGLGLPAPRSWLPGQLEAIDIRYPLFVKPRRGSGGRDSFKVRDARELQFFSQYVKDAIVQEYMPGPEITSDVVCGLDGVVLAVVSRRRIEVRSGEVAKGVTVSDPVVIDACVRVAQALHATGPITVQCMMKDGRAHFTEINARLGGGFPLGVAAGVDSPLWLLARAAGVAVDIPPLGTYRTGIYLTRFDDAFFLDAAAYDRLANARI